MNRNHIVVVEPTSGLCSRIFVLCDAYDLAKSYDKKMVVVWKKTADCNCDYFNVFSSAQFADVNCKVIQFSRYGCELKSVANFKSVKNFLMFIQECFRRIAFGCTYYPIRYCYRKRCSMYKNAYADGNAALDPESIRENSIYIEAYNGIHHKHDVSSACFSPKVLVEANKILEPAQGNCIGVHIRRTDHELAKGSLTVDFIKKMKELQREDDSLYFYLATDDWSEQDKLVSVFGEHILVQTEKILTRSTEQGMHSSVIDFLCLSKTKCILGSYESMFSEFSAKLGEIPLIIV